jgi:hypothetical protein
MAAVLVLLAPAVGHGAGLEAADVSFFGVNHGHNFSIMLEGGLLWHRQDFTWNSIEHEQGNFTFDQYDEVVEETAALGIRVLGILDYSAEWASSAPEIWDHGRDLAPPRDLDTWANYVYRTVEHFKGRVTHWEVWNEPNTNTFWQPKRDPHGYANLLRAAYVAAKKADPECTVLIGGMIGFGNDDLEYLDEVYSYGGAGYFDVMAWHPYPGDPNPCLDQFNFTDFMDALRSIMSSYGDGDSEIWFTEIAWGIGDGATREDQANYLVRSYVMSLAEGVDRLFWFNFRGPPSEEGSALLEHDFTPRPAFIAHAQLAKLLEKASYETRIDINDAECHAFAKGEERILFAWVPWNSTDVTFRFRTDAQDLQILDIYGEEISAEARGRKLKTTLTERPIIILGLDAADVQALNSGMSPLLPVAAVLAVGACGGAMLYRRPREPRARPRSIKPGTHCRKSFDPDLCYRCPDYQVRGGRSYCRRYGKYLED